MLKMAQNREGVILVQESKGQAQGVGQRQPSSLFNSFWGPLWRLQRLPAWPRAAAQVPGGQSRVAVEASFYLFSWTQSA